MTVLAAVLKKKSFQIIREHKGEGEGGGHNEDDCFYRFS